MLGRMVDYVYKLLFDAGDLKPLPKRRAAKVIVTPAEKKLHHRRLARWRRRQQSLFECDPPPQPKKKHRRRGRRRKRKIPWYDLPAGRVEELAKRSRTLRRDIAAFHAQIAEASQQVQSGWTSKHERKANHYPIKPIVVEPQRIEEIFIELRDVIE